MFAKRLKELREEKGLTQVEFAERVGIGTSTMTRYEIGDREPSLPIARKIADYLGVTIDYLSGKTDVKEQLSFTELNVLWNRMNDVNKAFFLRAGRHLIEMQCEETKREKEG